MLNYSRERYEDEIVNRQNQELNNKPVNNSEEITSAYGHVDWINDFNKAHSTASDEYECNFSNLTANTPIYNDESLGNTFTEDINQGAKEVVNIAVDDDVKTEKKRTLSNRARVHIVIYATLLMLVLSMIIANAWMANLNSLKRGKIVHADSNVVYADPEMLSQTSVGTIDSNKYYIEVEDQENNKIIANNWFDKVCDTVDKN